MDLHFPLTTDLLAVITFWIKHLRSILKDKCNLTIPQFRVLSCLEQHEALCLHDLAALLQLSPSTTNFIVNHLVANKLITRQHDPFDHRLVEITILPEGLKLARSGHRSIMMAETQFVEPLGIFLKNVVSQNIETFEDNYSFVSKTPNYLVDRSLLNTLVLYENKIGNLLNDYSIGNNEFRILFELAESSHTIKISDLARILLLKTSDITVACTKLEANGFLQKNRSRFDKRASLVDITSKGLSLVWHTATKIDGMFFRVSGDNPNNRAMMLKASRVVARYQRLHFVCS